MRLLTTLESRRAEKSSSEAKWPLAVRSAMAAAMAPSPQFLMAARP